MDEMTVSYTSFMDIRDNKLVLVERRISEGFYSSPQVTDLVVGSLIDIIV